MKWEVLRNYTCFLCVLVSSILWCGQVDAQEAFKTAPREVTIVTAVMGDVTYIRPSEQETPVPVVAFLKMQEGDLLTVAADARIHLLFVDRGIQESWQGLKVLKVEADGCLIQVKGAWQKGRPNELKPLLFEPQKVLQESALLAFNRREDLTLRAFPVLRELTEKVVSNIEESYTKLRKQFGDNDVTPDLYLLSVFADYQEYSRMQNLLDTLLEIYPGNAILTQWQTWVRTRIQETK